MYISINSYSDKGKTINYIYSCHGQDFNGNNDGIMAGPLTFYAPRQCWLTWFHGSFIVDTLVFTLRSK